MLYTPASQFNWNVNNFGSTYSDSGFGTAVTANGSANTKGANTQMLVGIAEDCYWIAICLLGQGTSATARRCYLDVKVDPAAGVGGAGSTWATVIPNLYAGGPGLTSGGWWYYFPLFLNAGTAIAVSMQDINGGIGMRCGIACYGKPSRPELVKCGSYVEAFGAVTASTSGTAFTPGTNALGSYSASLGTTARDLWWWQTGHGYNDTTVGGGTSITETEFVEIAASNDGGTTKEICVSGVMGHWSTTEVSGRGGLGLSLPIRFIKAGATIYVRAASTIIANATPTVIVYGMGG